MHQIRNLAIATLLIAALGVGLLVAPPQQQASANAVQAGKQKTINNLKQIALALHGYHDANQTLPPAAICDKNGKKLLSWRVAILPFLDQEALYKEFKLDEAWDSEANKKASATVVKTYVDPRVTDAGSKTNYRVFVGKDAAFGWEKGKRLTDFTDGSSNSIMVIAAGDPVEWAKPDDFEFDADKKLPDLTKPFADVIVVLADGSIKNIKSDREGFDKLLKLLIQINDGEVTPDF